jgi:hypothetical protein
MNQAKFGSRFLTNISTRLLRPILVLVLAFGALPQDSAGAEADSEALNALKLATGKAVDPVLQQRIKEFNDNFQSSEDALVSSRDLAAEKIRDNPNLTPAQKRRWTARIQDNYRANSWELVHRYREPINRRLEELSNLGLTDSQRVEAGDGTSVYVTREVEVNGQLQSVEFRNPEFSGAESDMDAQAGTKGSDQFARIAEAHGLKVVRDGNTVDIPAINYTINRNPSEMRDPTGSSADQARLFADARNEERFLNFGVSRDLPDIRVAVEKRDHMMKAAPAIKLAAQDPTLLLQLDQRKPLQKFAKSTRKMIENTPDSEIGPVLRKNGFQGDVAAFRQSLERLHGREWYSNGVNQDNVRAWFDASRELQEREIARADAGADRERQRAATEIDRLGQQLSRDDLPESERRRLTRELIRKKTSLIDANERIRQTRDAVAEEIAPQKRTPEDVVRTPQLYSNQPTKSTSRQKLNIVGEKGFRNVGTIMSGYSNFMKGFQVGTLLREGDVSGLAQFAANEVWDEISDRAIERVLPGYGQVSLAYDVGWGAGRLLGENMRLGPSGPTLDEYVEARLATAYDVLSGNREANWENERKSALVDYFVEQISENLDQVPLGMTPGEMLNIALGENKKGGNFFATLDEMTEQGLQAAENVRKEMAERQAKENARLIEEGQRTKLLDEALDLGGSPYDLAILGTNDLRAFIIRRKQEIADQDAIQIRGADYDFDSTNSVDEATYQDFRRNIEGLKSAAQRRYGLAGIEQQLEMGKAALERYDSGLAEIERIKRETAEIWEDVRRKKIQRAAENAEWNMFFREFITETNQALNDEYARQNEPRLLGDTSEVIDQGEGRDIKSDDQIATKPPVTEVFRHESVSFEFANGVDAKDGTIGIEKIECLDGPRAGSTQTLKFLERDKYDGDSTRKYFGFETYRSAGQAACGWAN